jgi:pimeloyl-ACP methyl ester carboxylesterase
VSIAPHTFQLGAFGLSALVAQSAEPKVRATVLAIPGGGYTKSYWHNSSLPGQSLLDVGSRRGFNVIALDRPGYGASTDLNPAQLTWDEQTKILLSLIDSLPSSLDLGAGVFLIGHSLGGCLSLLIGATGACSRLLGIDVSGVPFRFSTDPAPGSSIPIMPPRPSSRPWTRVPWSPSTAAKSAPGANHTTASRRPASI